MGGGRVGYDSETDEPQTWELQMPPRSLCVVGAEPAAGASAAAHFLQKGYAKLESLLPHDVLTYTAGYYQSRKQRTDRGGFYKEEQADRERESILARDRSVFQPFRLHVSPCLHPILHSLLLHSLLLHSLLLHSLLLHSLRLHTLLLHALLLHTLPRTFAQPTFAQPTFHDSISPESASCHNQVGT